MKGRLQTRSTRTVGDTVLAWSPKHTVNGIRVRDTSRAPKKIHATPKNLYWSSAKRAEAESKRFGNRIIVHSRSPVRSIMVCRFCDWPLGDLQDTRMTAEMLVRNMYEHMVNIHNIKQQNILRPGSVDRLTRRI